jgi:hypothetical protein
MLRASIGSRTVRIRASGGVITAKAGINVGKRPLGRSKNLAPHSHLVALGTKLRTRQRIGGKFRFLEPTPFHPHEPRSRSTGIMPANPFIRSASAAAAGSVRFTMRETIVKGIAKEVNRIGRKTGRAVGGVL